MDRRQSGNDAIGNMPEGQQQPLMEVLQNQPSNGENILGPNSTEIYCPICKQRRFSNVKYKTTCFTHSTAIFTCILGFIPCTCLPYCMKAWKDVHHHCPKCDSKLGICRIGR